MAQCKTRCSWRSLFALLLAGWAAVLSGSTALYAQDDAPPPAAAPPVTVTVRPAALHGWRFALETPEGVGSFVPGPAQPPLGAGSVQITTNARGAYAIGVAAYAGVALAEIDRLTYATYRSTYDPDDHTALNLQFDIDYNASDETNAAQGRLVFEPYKTSQPFGGVYQNVWQNWDALASNAVWWATAQPGAQVCPERAPCPWAEVLKLFPNAAIAGSGGQLLLHAGNSWGRAVTANADALVVGVAGVQTHYDFEPETPCAESCYVDALTGDDAFGGDTPASAKRTIQAALAQVRPGGAVIVAAGAYSEALTLAKAVTLLGPNQGVCANDSTQQATPNPARQAEAVLAPAGAIAFTLAPGVDDVTIDGFSVAAPAVGGVAASGAAGDFARITIRNNRFSSLTGAAISSAAGVRTAWAITCNRSDDGGAPFVALLGGENSAVTVAGNFLRGNSTNGVAAIVLENNTDITTTQNSIASFGGDAIRLAGGVLRASVTHNDLADAGVGVHLAATSSQENTWIEQVTIEYNQVRNVTQAAVLVDHDAEGQSGGVADLCICANTITQEAGRLADDASLIDLRLGESDDDPYGRIVVRETMLTLQGRTAGNAVYALRVRGALHQLDVVENQFAGGDVGGAGTASQPPTSGFYLQTGDARYGALPVTARVSLTDNVISGFEQGVTLFDPVRGVYGGLPAGALVTASRNTIAGNRQFGARSGAGEGFAAAGNWWGSADGPGEAGPGAGDRISENIAYCTWLDAPPPLGVATGFVHNRDARRDFCTIQAALDDAATLDGHTITTDARIYQEQVSVTKSITLTGAGAGASIIQAPAALTPATGAALVTISGAGVAAQVSHFTLAGPGDGVCGTLRAGIAVDGGAQAVIRDNEIRDIRNTPLLACAQGVGIAVGNHTLASPGRAEIANNRITGYQKAGVVVSGAGAHATVTNNWIEGAGPTSVLVQNGVQVSYGATAAITSNTITGHVFTPFNLVSTGILLYQADAGAAGNTLRNNQVGLYLVDSSGVHEGNIISVTTAALNSPGYWGIIVDAPPPGRIPHLALPATAARFTAAPRIAINQQTVASERGIQRVTVRNNLLVSDGAGIGLQADGGYGQLDIDLTATNNVIRGWSRGVNITQCTGSCTGAGYVAVDVRHNLLEGNGTALDNSSAGGQDIRTAQNWWGARSGPTSTRNPGGTGGSLKGDALFAPWLCAGADTDPAIGFQPDAAAQCGLAERMVILTQPQGGLEGFALPQQPVVRIEDRAGNLAVNFNGPVTIAPAPGSGVQVSGGVTVNAVQGVAHFTDVRVDGYGAGLTLQLSAPGLPPVVSEPIVVAPQTGAVTLRVAVVGQPPAAGWQVDGPTGVLTFPAPGGEISLDALHANESYTFTLAHKPGYDLQAGCVAGAAGENQVSVALDYQAHVVCTFTATAQPATVTIRQSVAGQTPVIDWEFAGDLGAFTLPAAGGERQFSVPAGVYQVKNTPRVSYTPSVTCTNGAGGGSQTLLVLAPGAQVSCTFAAAERTTALMLSKTVGLAQGECGASEIIGVPAGTVVYYCYTILNTGASPLSLHSLSDSEVGPVLADLDYVVPPGGAIDTVTLGRILSETVTATIVSEGVWTAATPDGPAARDYATASVNVLHASMDAVLTVGEGDSCGTRSSVEVAQGSKVNYCITLLNNGEVLLSRHTITLPGLGVTQQIDHLLAPGAFVRLTAAELPALGGVTIDAEQRATLTVNSTNPPANLIDAPHYLVAPDLFAAQSTAEAVVTVRANEKPAAANALYLPSLWR